MADQRFRYDEARSCDQMACAKTADMRAQRQCLHRALKLQAGEQVLDVGSGNGLMVREMAEIVGDGGMVTGVDIAQPMTNMARTHCHDLPNTDFLTASAEALPLDDSSFDLVTSAQCLSYVPDVRAALAEINRVLKADGRIVLLETDWASLVWNCSNQALMDKIMACYRQVYVDAHLPRTLSKKLSDTGFRVNRRSSFTIVNWTHSPNGYAGQMIQFMKSLAGSTGRISPEELRAWVADLATKEAAGDCLFSLNRYIFCASKRRA